MTTRRIGRFRVSAEMVNSYGDELRAVLGACFWAVRCEMFYDRNEFELVALSPQFDEVQEGNKIPTYVWTMTTHEPMGQVTAKADRVITI